MIFLLVSVMSFNAQEKIKQTSPSAKKLIVNNFQKNTLKQNWIVNNRNFIYKVGIIINQNYGGPISLIFLHNIKNKLPVVEFPLSAAMPSIPKCLLATNKPILSFN